MERIPLFTFISVLWISISYSSAQNTILGTETELDTSEHKLLDEIISNYQIVEIEISKKDFDLSKGKNLVRFDVGSRKFDLNLFDNNVTLSAEYDNPPHLLSGSLRFGGSVSLTINDDFIYGYIKYSDTHLYIEPLWYFEGDQPQNRYVIYDVKDVNKKNSHKCGVEHTEAHHKQIAPLKITNDCKITTLAIANTFDMVDEYGSTTAVINHNLGVLNNVQTNYRSEFDTNIEYDVVAHFVPATLGADPFDATVYADTLLTNFTILGKGGRNKGGSTGIFGVNYNMGALWTDRDICAPSGLDSCAVIGLAWVGGLNGQPAVMHHVLEDFNTSNAATLNVLQSHEMGHNWNYGSHDPTTGFVMSSSVNATDVWSSASQATISTYISNQNYLSDCSNISSPIADFSPLNSVVCVGTALEFEDQSQYGATRSWTFQDGTPSTSTDEKPSITYNTPGMKNVTLTSSNANGSNTITGTVNVETEPTINCTPNNPQSSLLYGGVKSFNFASISNTSSGSSASSIYENFACAQIATLTENANYPFSINRGTCGVVCDPPNSNNCTGFCNPCEVTRIYIDYNGDGYFNGSGELAFTSGGSGGCGIFSGSINTPTINPSAKGKILRLRIITDNALINSPCHNPNSGEVEDYGVYFELPQTVTDWYRDADNDTFGDINNVQSAPTQPSGYIADNTDCDDTDATVHPGATELCDGKLNNCNGNMLPTELDDDNDGYVTCTISPGSNPVKQGDDCDDIKNTVYPGAPELCDGIDNNCNNIADENCPLPPCDGVTLFIDNGNIMAINRAEQTIDSDALVNLNSVLYTAGNNIELLPNFEVTSGKTFEARIEPCVQNFQNVEGESEKRIIYDGDIKLGQIPNYFDIDEHITIQVNKRGKTKSSIFMEGENEDIYKEFLGQLSKLKTGTYNISVSSENHSFSSKLHITLIE